MATDKPAVMTYLNTAVYQRLVVFKDQQQIRSLSKAIELILGEYFGVAGEHSLSDESHLLNCNILKQNELLAETIGRLTEVLDSQGQLYRQLQLFQLLKLSTAEQPAPQREDASDPSPDPAGSFTDEFEQSLHAIGLSLHIAQQGLTGVKLAARLKVSASAVSRRRSTPGFIEWSRQVDPQGVGWKFMGATRRFHPIVEHEIMSKMGCMAKIS
ncbi:MAG TPA: hypothetical protein V6C65_29590 [Allocoleopsis sp.]